MAKTIDITEKLNFEENPKIRIKDKEIEVNSDAATMLKVMQITSKKTITNTDVLKIYELLFSEIERQKIEELKLKFDGLVTLVESAISLVAGDDDTQ